MTNLMTLEQLDFAVNDRIDEMVHFILPGKNFFAFF